MRRILVSQVPSNIAGLALDRTSVKVPSTEGKEVALWRLGSTTASQNAAAYAEH